MVRAFLFEVIQDREIWTDFNQIKNPAGASPVVSVQMDLLTGRAVSGGKGITTSRNLWDQSVSV